MAAAQRHARQNGHLHNILVFGINLTHGLIVAVKQDMEMLHKSPIPGLRFRITFWILWFNKNTKNLNIFASQKVLLFVRIETLYNKVNKYDLKLFIMKRISTFFSLAVATLFFAASVSAETLSEDPAYISGTAAGVGKYFKIIDSEYLNIELRSADAVKVKIESVPELIVLEVEAADGAHSAELTLAGFRANTTYHKYQDGYSNYEPLVTNSEGSFSFVQQLDQKHLIFIQPRKSTKFIRDDATGGDCLAIGNWDATAKVCQLTQDVNETIQIDGDSITFDGAGHLVTGFGSGAGIFSARKKVTIKNVTIRKFAYGVHLYNASECNLDAVSVEENNAGFYFRYANKNYISKNTLIFNKYGLRNSVSHENVVKENTFSKNREDGILNEYSNSNIFEENIISESANGIQINYGSNNVINNNSIKQMGNFGIYLAGAYNRLNGNVIENIARSFLWIARNSLENNEIGMDNTADDKAIYYLKNQIDKTFESKDIGSFYCINCSKIIIRNNRFSQRGVIYLFKTDNSLIEKEFSEETLDITLQNSNSNIVKDSDFAHVAMLQSHNNSIFGNNIIYQGDYSVFLDSYSLDNCFYQEKPIGGNYWSVNADDCRDLDDDGFCDVGYGIYASVGDKYPRIKRISRNADQDGYSSVLFLPGHQASRLYRKGLMGIEDQLWEPNRNQDVRQLYLDPEDGKSKDPNIYTSDAIDEAFGVAGNVYENFMQSMDEFVQSGAIGEWRAFPYDWRLPLEQIVDDGIKLRDGSTANVLAQIREMAQKSKSGKVTIIGHSNGGLLAKAIINRLSESDEDKLVDRLIMVGTPQIGTPKAVIGLLHGDGLTMGKGILLDKETARGFGENMSSAYNLLPSKKYFDIVQSPVMEFGDDVNEIYDFRSLFGDVIDNWDEFKYFLLGDNGARIEPEESDTDSPNVLKKFLFAKAEATHEKLDSWQAPAHMEVIQIAGWGLDTVRGIRYDDCDILFCPDKLSNLDRELIVTEDGDETVVLPSAVMMEGGERYYLNLKNYNNQKIINREHADIMEIESVQIFIKNIIKNEKKFADHISTEKPEVEDEDKRLRYRLHSPVKIDLYDENGNHTGIAKGNNRDSDIRRYEQQVPNSYYMEFGETKYAGAEGKIPQKVMLEGEDLGTFTLEIDEVFGTGETKNTTFKNIPVIVGMKVQMEVSDSVGVMNVDINGDGKTDATIKPESGLGKETSLEILEKMIGFLSIHETTTDRLINKIENARRQLEKGHIVAANAMLENVKWQIETFSRQNMAEKFRIPKEEAEKLVTIIESIQSMN